MYKDIDKIEDYIWNNLYCDKTNLFYDFRTSKEKDSHIVNLPLPEYISSQVPNPCGYGTGMEDSSLNGGIMLDSTVAAYEVTGDDKYREQAVKIYSGLRLCAEAHGYPGYIARSVSPIDKESVYLDSSRDQYTNWVFGAYRYYRSGFATAEHKASIAKAIVGIAQKHEREVTPENNYCLLRPDGKHGRVLGMWGNIEPHEFLRMPMIYLAAFYVSDDIHWKEMYLKYRQEALERSFEIDCSKLWHAYCSLQMQYSVRLLYELDEDEHYRAEYKRLMCKVADYYVQRIVSECEDLVSGKSGVDLCASYGVWNKLQARFTGFIGGYAYYNPTHPKEAADAFYALRDIGNSAQVIALAGNAEQRILDAVISVADAIDTENHFTGGPIDLYGAYWYLTKDLKERGILK
ncbi:MAG: hypothetical protein E7583_02130 [Ruminococcaceae bacterium]|nr:hypothetical protein [Oscillospiraceae bacterium]